MPDMSAVFDITPCLRLHRRHESPGACSRSAVRHAFERIDLVDHNAADLSRRSLAHRPFAALASRRRKALRGSHQYARGCRTASQKCPSADSVLWFQVHVDGKYIAGLSAFFTARALSGSRRKNGVNLGRHDHEVGA